MQMFGLTREEEHGLEALLMNEEASGINGRKCCHEEALDADLLQALAEQGFLAVDGAEFVLTEKGRAAGESVVRRHRLTEVLLDTVLGLDLKRAFDVGCQAEHGMQPEMVEAFCTLLGHPSVCPHGKRIPPGPCCQAHSTTVESRVVPLTGLRPGERGRIIFIKPRSHGRLHRLASLGVSPGVVVELHQRKPAFCFRFEGTELAVEEDVAKDIHVMKLDE